MNNSETLLRYAFCYFMVFILTWISKRNKSNRLFDANGIPAVNTGDLIGLHLAGILWFGLIPLTWFDQSFKTIVAGNRPPSLSWVLLFVAVLILISVTAFRASRQVHIKREYIHILQNNFFYYYFPIRIIFLCAYELFFRGILLFYCIKWVGIFPAMSITTGLTVLIHVFTNKKEMWACIPFGIILCSCSIAIYAVWPAIVLHLALSLVYEVSAVTQFLTPLKTTK